MYICVRVIKIQLRKCYCFHRKTNLCFQSIQPSHPLEISFKNSLVLKGFQFTGSGI